MMYRQISDDFGGEFLGDVELGLRVMLGHEMEAVFPNHTITVRTVNAFFIREGMEVEEGSRI